MVEYVMQYRDGRWVKRDDSTGPMSTGGYPFPVNELHEATVWDDKMKALKYRATMSADWIVHSLERKTTQVMVTPAEQAEAKGDDEFLEYQRLAKKYGVTGTGECPFNEAWRGKCKASPEVGELYCERHKKERCFKCGAQATRDCGHTSQFVCGTPMCDQHEHH